jgi:hypothetical protein
VSVTDPMPELRAAPTNITYFGHCRFCSLSLNVQYIKSLRAKARGIILKAKLLLEPSKSALGTLVNYPRTDFPSMQECA